MGKCKECMLEDDAYKEALRKVELNNPSLLFEQEKLNKRKKDVDALYTKLHILYIIAYIIAIMSLIIANLCNVIPSSILLFGTGVLCMIIMLLNLFTLSWYRRFWDYAAGKDYELYEQEKDEFAKVGYELP